MFEFPYPPMYRTDFFEDRLHNIMLLFDNTVLKELTSVITADQDNTKLPEEKPDCVLDYKSVPQISYALAGSFGGWPGHHALLVEVLSSFITVEY